MPSSQRKFQGEAVDTEKRARRFAATSSVTAFRISSDGGTSLGEDGKIKGLVQSASITAMAMMHIEIAVEESKVSRHSEIYKLLKNEGVESLVSLENDVAPNVDNIMHAHPINPLLEHRTRIY